MWLKSYLLIWGHLDSVKPGGICEPLLSNSAFPWLLKSLAPSLCQICKTGTRKWSECSVQPKMALSGTASLASHREALPPRIGSIGIASEKKEIKVETPGSHGSPLPWFIWSSDCKTWLPPLWVFLLRILLHEETIGCCASLLRQVQFSSVQSFSRVWLFATPWTAARQASLGALSWLCFLLTGL